MSGLARQHAPAQATVPPEQSSLATDFGSNMVAQEQLAATSQGCSLLDGFGDPLGLLRDEGEAAEETLAIPNQDIIYEQLAHRFAYAPETAAGSPELATWGYAIDDALSPPHDPSTGFGMTVFRPTEAALANRAAHEGELGGVLRPVVAFRGSDTDSLSDFLTDWLNNDLAQEGVGMPQFNAHREEIGAAIGALGGCDVVGHSLGGALAQLAACNFGGISRCVTFQAPGISAEEAAKQPDEVESTHYRVEGDVVSLVGDEMTDGEVVEIDLEGGAIGSEHGAYPLAAIADDRDDAILEGIEGEAGVDVGEVTRRDSDDVEQGGERVRQRLHDVINAVRNVAYTILAPFLLPSAVVALTGLFLLLVMEFVLALPACAEELDWDMFEHRMLEPVIEIIESLDVQRDLAEQLAAALVNAAWLVLVEVLGAELA